MLLALSASVIVMLVLLWEVAWPVASERIERWRASRRLIVADGYDPGRERRAEQKARALLRSCVNDEEWAMYRDLGFIRVWGGLAEGPLADRDGRGRAVRVPDLPAQAARRLPAADATAAERVLHHVPRRDPAVRLGAAAGLRRRAGEVDGADRR